MPSLTEFHIAAFANITFDIPYYDKLSKDRKIIDLCAGFGRVCNRLHSLNHDVYALELCKNNYAHINLPQEKKFNQNVLDNLPCEHKFDLIIAPFNSFMMFNTNEDIKKFFKNISLLSHPDTIISLSYYHHDHWLKYEIGDFLINVDGREYYYTSDYFINKKNKSAKWSDIFIDKSTLKEVARIDYNTRIYDNIGQVNFFCNQYNLNCIDIIDDFYEEGEFEQGWKEFIILKD